MQYYGLRINRRYCEFFGLLPFIILLSLNFYPRDAVLARYVLLPCVCPSVCLPQVGVLLERHRAGF